jgi:hypothetical protein
VLVNVFSFSFRLSIFCHSRHSFSNHPPGGGPASCANWMAVASGNRHREGQTRHCHSPSINSDMTNTESSGLRGCDTRHIRFISVLCGWYRFLRFQRHRRGVLGVRLAHMAQLRQTFNVCLLISNRRYRARGGCIVSTPLFNTLRYSRDTGRAIAIAGPPQSGICASASDLSR